MVPVTIPDVGAADQPLRLTAWFVEPGDEVSSGDRLCEILLSGMTCDVTAACSGRLVRIEKDLDVDVRPGDVAAWIDAEAAPA